MEASSSRKLAMIPKWRDLFTSPPSGPMWAKRWVLSAQAPTAAAAFDENVSVASWKAKPSWYLVATADRAIQPSLERAMAKAINAKTVEIASSHVAMLARPEETANLILEAAGRASPSNVGLKSA